MFGEDRDGGGHRRAGRARRDRAQARAPALLRRRLRVRVGDQHRAAALDVAQPELARRGQQLLARRAARARSTAETKTAIASSEARSGARTRSTSEAISVLTRRIRPCAGAARERRRSAPDLDVADAQLDRLHAGGAREQGLLVRGERAATATAWPARSKTTTLASSTRAGRAHDGGQPGPRLDGRSDLVEGGEVQRVRHERTTIRS